MSAKQKVIGRYWLRSYPPDGIEFDSSTGFPFLFNRRYKSLIPKLKWVRVLLVEEPEKRKTKVSVKK